MVVVCLHLTRALDGQTGSISFATSFGWPAVFVQQLEALFGA
jgi:hypothetical protein